MKIYLSESFKDDYDNLKSYFILIENMFYLLQYYYCFRLCPNEGYIILYTLHTVISQVFIREHFSNEKWVKIILV